jgi:LacI family transcriptional regulator
MINVKKKLSAEVSKSGKVKIDDVARFANVSPATVSRVLNHPDIVREELQAKVHAAIKALAYTPDNAARALMSRRSRAIGIVVPTLKTSIFAEGIEALQVRLSESGYTLLIAASQYDPNREVQEIRTLVERGVDGIVLVGNSHMSEAFEIIRRHQMPVVTTYVKHSPDGVPAIGIDNENAIFQLTQHLLQIGHRNYGVVVNTQASSDRSRARLEGINRALSGAGIVLDGAHVVKSNHLVLNGRQGLRELLRHDPSITAVICTTDTLALGALAEAKALGLRVPKDLSITGFDDIELAAHLEPALTTIRTPAKDIGRVAADYLIAAINGTRAPENLTLPFEVVLRASTSRPRNKPLRADLLSR